MSSARELHHGDAAVRRTRARRGRQRRVGPGARGRAALRPGVRKLVDYGELGHRFRYEHTADPAAGRQGPRRRRHQWIGCVREHGAVHANCVADDRDHRVGGHRAGVRHADQHGHRERAREPAAGRVHQLEALRAQQPDVLRHPRVRADSDTLSRLRRIRAVAGVHAQPRPGTYRWIATYSGDANTWSTGRRVVQRPQRGHDGHDRAPNARLHHGHHRRRCRVAAAGGQLRERVPARPMGLARSKWPTRPGTS